MGVSPFKVSNCGCEVVNNKPRNNNPNPYSFKLLSTEKIGRYIITRVLYPNCKNFEGEKILVFENVSILDICKAKYLDPHFCDNNHLSPVARFRPDRWNHAVAFCKSLKD